VRLVDLHTKTFLLLHGQALNMEVARLEVADYDGEWMNAGYSTNTNANLV